MPRCENAVYAQLNEIFQRFKRIHGHIEGSVKCDCQWSGCFDESPRAGFVNLAIHCQQAEYNTIDPQRFSDFDVTEHDVNLEIGVEKVTASGAYHHENVQGHVFQA